MLKSNPTTITLANLLIELFILRTFIQSSGTCRRLLQTPQFHSFIRKEQQVIRVPKRLISDRKQGPSYRHAPADRYRRSTPQSEEALVVTRHARVGRGKERKMGKRVERRWKPAASGDEWCSNTMEWNGGILNYRRFRGQNWIELFLYDYLVCELPNYIHLRRDIQLKIMKFDFE